MHKRAFKWNVCVLAMTVFAAATGLRGQDIQRLCADLSRRRSDSGGADDQPPEPGCRRPAGR